jgi:hypothetical protein
MGRFIPLFGSIARVIWQQITQMNDRQMSFRQEQNPAYRQPAFLLFFLIKKTGRVKCGLLDSLY